MDPAPKLTITQAVALGAMHGPAELLPISSSGHATALPWLLGWRYSELDDGARKAFEVALHAGSAAAWLLSPGGGEAIRPRDRRQLVFAGLASAPAAAAGLAFEHPIERGLGTPPVIATGLAIGALAMVAADRGRASREAEEAGPADAAWLGLAQACALLPGISRTGATLTAARWRAFRPRAAWGLSARVATPVVGGAAALKLLRLARRRPAPAETAGLVAGTAASFGSTLVAARALRPLDRGWPLAPFAAYRLALALAIAVRLRRPDRAPTVPRSRT